MKWSSYAVHALCSKRGGHYPAVQLLLGALALAAISVTSGAAEQPFPTKPIRWLVPFAAGGAGDLLSRIVAAKMSANMGQQVVIDNRPGAGAIVSLMAGLQAPADGYTVVLAGNGVAITQSLFKSLPYNILTDFTQISTLADFDFVLVTAANSNFSSVSDMVAFAKESPGKLSIATLTIGSTQHLIAALFVSKAGIQAQTVPYKTTPAVVAALRGGEVPVAFESIAGVIGQINAGALKPIAVAAAKRTPMLPNVPTIAESGVPEFEATSWAALSVRAGTARSIVNRLHKEVVAAVNSAEVKQKLLDLGAVARTSDSPEDARKLMVSEVAQWKAVIERANIERQ